LDQLSEEVAYIAYYFHWSHDEVLSMEHWERQQWISEIAKINQKINDETKRGSTEPWR
jgi:hypothetical protein